MVIAFPKIPRITSACIAELMTKRKYSGMRLGDHHAFFFFLEMDRYCFFLLISREEMSFVVVAAI